VRIGVIGAGAMGSAVGAAASRNGHRVTVCGTWLDGDLVRAIQARMIHPRLGVRLSGDVDAVPWGSRDSVYEESDLIVVAVNSKGYRNIMEEVLARCGNGQVVLVVTKGLVEDGSGVVEFLHEFEQRSGVGGEGVEVGYMGGPCKANEVAAGSATWGVVCNRDLVVCNRVAEVFCGSGLELVGSADVVGVEVAAVMKNVFAIGLGICDGVGKRSDSGEVPLYDLRSAVFTEAVQEMARVAEWCGGLAATVYGLAGVGDLEVTGLAGRNRDFGERLGSNGGKSREILRQMEAAGLTVEGYAAAGMLARWCEGNGRMRLDDLPLLKSLVRVIAYDDVVDCAELAHACGEGLRG